MREITWSLKEILTSSEQVEFREHFCLLFTLVGIGHRKKIQDINMKKENKNKFIIQRKIGYNTSCFFSRWISR